MNIAVIPNIKKDSGLFCTAELLQYLYDRPCMLLLCDALYKDLKEKESLAPFFEKLHFLSEEQLYAKADYIIVLGGDGSILKVAHRAMQRKTPILGINLGKVGYLADVEVSELDLLDRLFSGEYQTESRAMLDCRVIREDKEIADCTALNDIVIANGSLSRMIAAELSCHGKKIADYHSDGLIFATPTGSTAYSLSAGGPVVDPSLDSIIVTPVCAHSLTARPLIFSSSGMIEVKNTTEEDRLVYLTADGRRNIQLQPGDRVQIRKSDYLTALIRLKDESFLNVLHNKMKERK